MYTEGREMAVFTDQQFEFALMKMRGMVDYEFNVKLKPGVYVIKHFLSVIYEISY
jgi:predicted homoserine dehydrogenase-like protein